MEPQNVQPAENKEENELASDKAAHKAPASSSVSTPKRPLRGRGASRSKTEVSCSPDTNGAASSAPSSGRVLRDRSTRGVPAWRQSDTIGDTEEPGRDGGANRRRKPACPRRRRNAAAGSSTIASGTGGDAGPVADSDGNKDLTDNRAPRGRRPRPPRGLPRMVCKSEPDTETAYVEADKDVGKKTVGSEKKEEEDAILPGEEDPPFVDDPSDQNYQPQHQSGAEEEISSDEDVPFRDDLNDQSYDPKAEREPPKPRRRPPPRQKDKREKAPVKEKEPEIKTEGGEGADVKQENEFGEVTEPPRKRGRRRKDDKSPRLPKRRKKPPVQYVRCEMEGCGTVLAHPRYLQHHIKYQHLLKKKYVCPHPSCGRLFRLQKQLLRHAKHHTDQRDYICEFCARAFKSSHNLAVHRMIHTGEKPLQCEICGFTCRQKASLNWHMKKHDADASYQFSCSICGKKFEKKDSVVAHKAKSHPEVLIAEAMLANAGALITTPGALLEANAGAEVVVGQEHTLHAMQVPVTLTLPAGEEEEHQPPPLPVPHHLHMPLQFVSATGAAAQAPPPPLHQLPLQAYGPGLTAQILHMTFQPVAQQLPLQAVSTQRAPNAPLLSQTHAPNAPLLSQTQSEGATDCRESLGFGANSVPPSSSPPPSAPPQEAPGMGVAWEEDGENGNVGGVWERGGEAEGQGLADGSEEQVQHGLM